MAERNAEIVRRYLAGETTPAIGRDYGIGACRVLQITKAAGAYRPRISDFPHSGGGVRKPETTALRNDVVALFNQGHTQAEIGIRLGITRGAAGRLIAEARARGAYVLSYTPLEIGRRAAASQRTNAGEVAYHAKLDDMRSILRRKSMNESPRPDTPE